MAMRLRRIFSELADLITINISVSNGVVTLQGKVTDNKTVDKALKFAHQIEDVDEVENNLVVTNSLVQRLEKTFHKLKVGGEQLLAGLPLMLLALLVFYLFWIGGRWLSKRQSIYRRITGNFFIADLLGKLVHLVFILIGIILALSLLDATALLGTILGAAGIFGLAISFAVRDTVENFIASILLSIRIPFEVNDFVDIDGRTGNVARLTSRATILISPDGNHTRIPNSAVYKATIVNYTRKPERRFQFDLGVGTGENLTHVQILVLQTLKSLPGILSEPKPQAIIDGLGDSNVVLQVYAWVNQKNHDFLKVRSEAIKTIKEKIDKADIALPNPIFDVRISRDHVDHSNLSDTAKKLHDNTDTDEEIKDVARDQTMEKQIAQENVEHGTENLLDRNADKEI